MSLEDVYCIGHLHAVQAALEAAEGRGLIQRDFTHVRPTELGFDFLSDLQSMFLPP